MKTNHIILLTIFVIGMSILSIILINNNNDKGDDSGLKKNTSQEFKSQLPDISTVNAEESPFLYDYLNGYLWNKSRAIKVPRAGAEVYAINDKMDDVYISNYTVKDRIDFVPNLGTNPEPVPVEKSKFDALLKDYKKKFPKFVHTEGDYTFILVSHSDLDEEKDQVNFMLSKGIDFKSFEHQLKNSAGKFYKDKLANGLGYDAEDLRKYPYEENLKSIGVDIRDKFWDDHNYGAVQFYKNSDEEIYTVTYPDANVYAITTPSKNIFRFVDTKSSTKERKLDDYIKNAELEKIKPEDVEKAVKNK